MNQLKPCLLAVGLLLLSGCATNYNISEQQLTNYLNKELSFDYQQGNNIFGASLKLENVKVQLGEKPNTVKVTANSDVIVHTPLVPLRADLTTEFEAKPWYNTHNKGIYLKDLQLTQISSLPTDIGKSINLVSPALMKYVRGYLESQPIYVLDQNNLGQRMLAKITKEIKVQPGKLSLIFN